MAMHNEKIFMNLYAWIKSARLLPGNLQDNIFLSFNGSDPWGINPQVYCYRHYESDDLCNDEGEPDSIDAEKYWEDVGHRY